MRRKKVKTGSKTNEALLEKVKIYLRLFKKYYPDAHCALDHETPEQLLVATILSAQCTDERVNLVTKVLFAEYPDLFALAEAPLDTLEHIVRPTGFFKNKAMNIKKMAQKLVNEKEGLVPKDFDYLTELPGVGRKTANVVMGNSFNIASGIVVDTHVRRLSRRLGLTKKDDPVKIEQDLLPIVPEKDWVMFSHWLIWHGRKVCKARSPQCHQCFLEDLCPKKID